MAKARQGMTNYLATRVILLKTPGSGRSENLQMFPNLRHSQLISLNLTATTCRPNRMPKPLGKTNLDGSACRFVRRLLLEAHGIAGRPGRLSQKETPFECSTTAGIRMKFGC
jgi:hypothetical protein